MRRALIGWLLCAVLPAGEAPARNLHGVTVHILDGEFDAPERVPSGPTAVTFLNKGWHPHRVAVVRLPDAPDAEPLDPALSLDTGLPAGVVSLGGIGMERPEGMGQVVMALAPGRYAFVCDLSSAEVHPGRSLVHPFQVLPFATSPLPPHSLRFQIGDAALELPSVVAPGEHLLRIENAGQRLHGLRVARLRPGRTQADAKRWLESGGPSPVIDMGGSAPLSPGQALVLPVTLATGDYVVYAPIETGDGPRFEPGLLSVFAVRTAAGS